MGLNCLGTILIIVLVSSTSWAQDSIPEVIYEKHTAYKDLFPNRITARLFYVNTSNSLMIKDRNSNLFFKLNPNKQNRIGASVSFRSLTVSYSFAPNFLAENQDNDNSKLFNLNLRTYFGKHWMQTLDLYQEKGFYVENNDINIYFPRFKSFKIGGATSYILNKNFSFRALVSQDEKQVKSVGSFIPRLVYYYTQINLRTDNDSVDSKLESFDLAFAPSYYYNFVPTKNLFLSAGVSAGIGLNYSTSTDETMVSLLTELNFRGSLTYSINDFYLGTHYNYLILNHNTDRSSYVKDGIPFFQIFLGYRFKAPKKLVYKTDAINKKLKLKK